ncbi:MAG TPA: outer membrane beta-barrel protein [Candidatus Saccharimonadales bacterium]|nr:outer membrane beta-barrel protein [Candidatus Saccharimonadales bacterium]
MQKRIALWAVLLFCLVGSQNAWAKTDLGWRSAGVDAGFVDPENVDGTLGFGAFANLGNLSPDVRLQPHLGYWSKTEEFNGGDKVSVSDIGLSARALYMFHGTSPKFRPYAGGGLGLHFVHAKAEFAEQDLGGGFIIPAMESSDTMTKLGLDLGGGFTTPLSEKTDLCVDLWYTAISDVGHLSFKAGVSFDLGGSPRAEAPAPQPTHRTRARR